MCRISFRLQHLFSMQVHVIGMHEYKDDLDPSPQNLDKEVASSLHCQKILGFILFIYFF